MIVCLCHRVSDRDIRAAVAAGTRCFDTLQDELRVASSCGCCHDCAREVFDEACAAATGAGRVAVTIRLHPAAAEAATRP